VFRKGELADGEAVYRLICDMESKALPREPFFAIYAKQLKCSGYACMVWECEGRVVGVIDLRLEEQLHHAGKIAEIMEFVVDPAHRGKGVGKEMFAAACEKARAEGCVQIEVACNRLRTDTHRFYLREGMHDFHHKFSKTLTGEDIAQNALGR